MHSPSGRSSRRVFYGWYVVYAIALVMTTTAGLAFYNLPVLLDAFVTQRDWPVGLVSNATATFFLAAGLGGVGAGQLVDRFDARYVIIANTTLAALALLSIAVISEPWQLFAFYIVFGAAYGGCGLVPTTTIVARWFERQRPLALSIASTGLSLGGIICTPISALLILHLGLAGAAPWIALIFFLGVVPVTLLVIRAGPQPMGLLPDGEIHDAANGPRAETPSTPFAVVLRSRYFIVIAITFLFALGTQVGGIAHIFRLVSTRVDHETATAAMAMFALSSLVGRLTVGWMLLRISSRGMTYALIAVQTASLTGLAFAEGAVPLVVMVFLFALTSGSMLMMQPLLLAEAFGVKHYGRIYSANQLVGVVGYALGPALIGVLYETSGGYLVAYLAVAAISFLSMGVLALSGRR